MIGSVGDSSNRTPARTARAASAVAIAAGTPMASPTGDNPEGFADHHPRDLTGQGAERHSDADLALASGNRRGDGAVDADRGEYRGQRADSARERRQHALFDEHGRDLVFQADN